MPVSGMIKGTNTGEFPSNFDTLLRILNPKDSLEAVTTRAFGLFMPLLLGVSYLVIYGFSKFSTARQDRANSAQIQKIGLFIVPLSVYVIAKSSYTLNHFYLIETGYWYYVGPVICVNFIAALLIGILFDKGILSKLFLATVIALMQIFNLTYTYQKIQSKNVMHAVFVNRDQLRRDLREIFNTNVKFIDGTDGIYSFVLDSPSQSARGFTINKEGYEAFKSGGYKEYYNYLLENDFGVLIGLNVYQHPVPGSITVVPIYTDPATGTVFSQLEHTSPSNNDQSIIVDK